MSTRYLAFFGMAVFFGGIFVFMLVSNVSTITPAVPKISRVTPLADTQPYLPPPPEVQAPTSSVLTSTKTSGVSAVLPSASDIPNQTPLQNPPGVMKGIYLTGWSAGSAKKIQSVLALIKRTGLNTVVIDSKDYSGTLSYAAQIPLAKSSGAFAEIKIRNPNALIKELHDNGIYVIGRITVFQDPVLAKAHPEWALKNKTTGKVWTDNHGLAWMDPAATPVWDYVTSIAQDASARGFDEIQFDYVRFASDGSLGDISFPYWDGKIPKATVIAHFFKYLRAHLGDATISADLFGLSTVNHDDLGIGQVIENAYQYFDYVSPMVYPSHYANGFLGYKNPAKHPYEVVNYSMEHALQRLTTDDQKRITNRPSSTSETGTSSVISDTPSVIRYRAKLRPWLQDFDLGATYDGVMVGKEMQAVRDTFEKGTSSEFYGGWLLWDAKNVYNGFQEMQSR